MGDQVYVVSLREIDQTQVASVGGKGANLGELSRLEGINVPAGFCVTTAAFAQLLQELPRARERLDRLAALPAGDGDALRALSAELRQTLETAPMPAVVAQAITRQLRPQVAYAVRSSATTEDSPAASFAGQHDTFLNVNGAAEVLRQVSRCWASLFTERAVTYRLRNGFDHRKVQMAVVVQEQLVPQAAGTLFTADPLTFNRRVTKVEATVGLGEALVSGVVNADTYTVRGGEVVFSKVGATGAVLTTEQVLTLAKLGRRIEAHFKAPQDLEWCLVDGAFHLVQSRPITTLYPIPVAGDDQPHLYVSVGHQQMMTDAMKPLGLSLFQLTALRPMYEAGGRLFVDVAQGLTSPASRAGLLEALGKSDPLIRDALQTVLDHGDLLQSPPAPLEAPARPPAPTAPAAPPLETNSAIVLELIARAQTSLGVLRRELDTRSGLELLDFVLTDLTELKRLMYDAQSQQVIMAAMQATFWLNENLQAWLGEKNAADVLTQSVAHNVTSQMGLALLDVADSIRPFPAVVAFLRQVKDDQFLDQLPSLEGGAAAQAAIVTFLDRYGMRGVGEIDVTRPRFRERPSTLLSMLLNNLENFAAGESQRRFAQGFAAAQAKRHDVLERLRALPDGQRKAEDAERMIDRVRTFAGYREYPKYTMVGRFDAYKQALLREADRLVAARVLNDREDLFFLTFQEVRELVRTQHAPAQLLAQRKQAFRLQQGLVPPRVLTSDGEVVSGSYRRDDVPPGALVGLPVSAGSVEGRARVLLNLAEAKLDAGDILVTPFTDPSWTPLFVAIKGLVTEVGGLMTHGAVIAREYGLPAVVGVQHATQLIRDRQLIRVHGTSGVVELLES